MRRLQCSYVFLRKGHKARIRLVSGLKVKDILIAIPEDLVAIGLLPRLPAIGIISRTWLGGTGEWQRMLLAGLDFSVLATVARVLVLFGSGVAKVATVAVATSSQLHTKTTKRH